MQTVCRFSLQYLLILSFILPVPHAWAQECSGVLPVSPRTPEVQYWHDQFITAYKDGRSEAQLYSLLKLGLAKNIKENYTLNRVSKEITDALELNSVDKRASRFKSPGRAAAKLLHFLGGSHLFTKQVFDTPRPKEEPRKRKVAKALFDHAFYFAGPWFWALLTTDIRPRLSGEESLVHSAINAAIDERLLDDIAQIENATPDHAKYILQERLSSVADQVSWTPQTLRKAGRIIIPWALLLTFSMNFYGAMPRRIAEIAMNLSLPYEYGFYMDAQYFADVKRSLGEPLQGRVLLAYTSAFDPRIDRKEQPPFAIPAFKRFTEHASEVVLQRISDTAELAKQDLSTFDNVIIFSHGNIDDLQIGLDASGLSHLKENANLIFVACMVGQKVSDSPEQWISFAKALLNGGKAIVSTQNVWVQFDLQVVQELSETEKTELALKRLQAALLEGSGVAQVAALYQLGEAAVSEYGLKPKGIRVYDSKTDEVHYIPSVEPLTED